MIHQLAKCYSVSKRIIEDEYTERDFWLMLGRENLDGARYEYDNPKK